MAVGSITVVGILSTLAMLGCSSDESGSRDTGSAASLTTIAPSTASAPTTTPTVDITSRESTSTAVGPTSTTTAPVPAPRFELVMPDAAASGPATSDTCCASDPPNPNDAYFMAWTALGGAQDGLIVADVRVAPRSAGPEGDYATELLAQAPEGQAWLLTPRNIGGTPVDFGFEVHWQRADGDVWMFRSSGLTAERLVEVVMQATPGSDVPVELPDPAMLLVDVAERGSGVVVRQEYELSGGIVNVTVRNDGGAFDLLVLGPDITTTTVADAPGYLAALLNGQIEVVWNAGDGWWATASISPTIADRAEEIIDAITRTATDPVGHRLRLVFSLGGHPFSTEGTWDDCRGVGDPARGPGWAVTVTADDGTELGRGEFRSLTEADLVDPNFGETAQHAKSHPPGRYDGADCVLVAELDVLDSDVYRIHYSDTVGIPYTREQLEQQQWLIHEARG